MEGGAVGHNFERDTPNINCNFKTIASHSKWFQHIHDTLTKITSQYERSIRSYDINKNEVNTIKLSKHNSLNTQTCKQINTKLTLYMVCS
jgi:hypothetical protein